MSTDNNQVFGQVADTTVKEIAVVNIEDAGSFSFNPNEVETTRPDNFKPGYFSLFDVLAHLSIRGEIELDYYIDDSMCFDL
ncbi:MAG: hypothetical protein SCJ97_10780 [Bacillota bacterium]|nr:hypothetical protein [Bacillota bacterium]